MAREIAARHAARKAAERHGHRSESLAALWLRMKGYRILGRRIKTRAGEIDLIALPLFGPVCIVEVKARRMLWDAAGAVAPTQRTRITRAALLYLAGRPGLAARGVRFDIIAVAGFPPRHFRDVWRADD
jgi:putative endonuclease